jgi:photosystem II stability/assembly factor-like uncharacterized protein
MQKSRLLTGVITLLMVSVVISLSGARASAAHEAANAASAGPSYYFPIIGQSHSEAHWTGPSGGSVVAIANDPINTNIIYAGSWGGGVHKSTDGGASWKFAGKGIPNGLIDSLAVDPVTPTTVYAGTHGDGVYKTTDGGATWAAMHTGMQDHAVVYTLTVNPGNHALVYAGTRGRPATPGPPWLGILYKSNDYGNNWFPVLQNIGGSDDQDWVYSVRVNPSSPNMIIAAAHEHGPYVAYDYGNAGDWFSPEAVPDWSGRAIAFDPRSWLQTAFYATWHGDGLYRSTNGGYHWELTNSGLGFAKIYPNGIVFDTVNPDVVYMASFGDQVHGVMKSSNAGNDWSHIDIANRYIYSVGTLAKSQGVIFAGTLLDGIYKSTNGGANWSHNNKGLMNTNISGVVFKAPKNIYVSTKGLGIFRSTDGGVTWAEFNTGLSARDINGLTLNAANPNLLYALTSTAGMQVNDLSKSNGWALASIPYQEPLKPPEDQPQHTAESSVTVHEPIEELLGYTPSYDEPFQAVGITAPVLSMAFAPSNGQTAYLGTDGYGMYKTLYGGTSFGYVGLSGVAIRSIAINPTTEKYVYVATNILGNVVATNNAGVSWFSLPLIPGSPVVNSVGILANEPNWVYAGTSQGLWRYDQIKWSLVGFSDLAVTAVKGSPFSSEILYVGTENGTYFSQDRKIWFSIAEGLSPGFTVTTISFMTLNGENFVLTGTNAHSVLQAPVP